MYAHRYINVKVNLPEYLITNARLNIQDIMWFRQKKIAHSAGLIVRNFGWRTLLELLKISLQCQHIHSKFEA